MNQKAFSLYLILLSCLTMAAFSTSCSKKALKTASEPLNVAVIVGGHSFDTLDFYQLFDKMPELRVQHIMLEKTATFFDEAANLDYDVFVFYNFRNRLNTEGKKNFLELTQKGLGLVFLHHSLMGFDDWPEFKNIVGAKYYHKGEAPADKLGTFKHDVNMNIKIENTDHPITKGLKDFTLFDEVYGNYWVSEGNKLLMTTDHPLSQKEVGWTRQYGNSKIVLIQPGHGKEALRDDRYAKIVKRAILWSILTTG